MTQPDAKTTNNRPIVEIVIDDLRDRMKIGIETYGKPLTAFNGRNALVDAYEEELDRIQYIKQWIEERKVLINALRIYAEEPNGDIARNLLKELNEI